MNVSKASHYWNTLKIKLLLPFLVTSLNFPSLSSGGICDELLPLLQDARVDIGAFFKAARALADQKQVNKTIQEDLADREKKLGEFWNKMGWRERYCCGRLGGNRKTYLKYLALWNRVEELRHPKWEATQNLRERTAEFNKVLAESVDLWVRHVGLSTHTPANVRAALEVARDAYQTFDKALSHEDWRFRYALYDYDPARDELAASLRQERRHKKYEAAQGRRKIAAQSLIEALTSVGSALETSGHDPSLWNLFASSISGTLADLSLPTPNKVLPDYAYNELDPLPSIRIGLAAFPQ